MSSYESVQRLRAIGKIRQRLSYLKDALFALIRSSSEAFAKPALTVVAKRQDDPQDWLIKILYLEACSEVAAGLSHWP